MSSPVCLGAFAGFNLVAFVLVFLYVEETRLVSLEDLDFVYAVPKSVFWRFQAFTYLPWLLREYVPYVFYRYMLCQSMHAVEPGDPESLVSRAPPQPPQLYVKRIGEVSPKSQEPEDFNKLEYDDDCA